jgi:DNA-binding transcriptional LysR family regulator
MSLNLNHLAVFHAIAEAGSVTRAAERLMVSQPAVSKQLKELERALRVRLLEPYAARIFALADEAEGALTDLGALRRGTLTVGATPTIATYLLPEVLVYYRQRFPGVRVDVETADAELLRPRIVDGEIDVALADEKLTFPGMERRQLMMATFVAVAEPRHPLARRRRIRLTDLMAETLVTRDARSREQPIVERHLAEAGLAPAATLALGGTEAVKRAVQAGLGVAIVPRLAVGGEVAAGRLAILRVSDLSLARPIYEIRNGRQTPGKAAHALHCILEHAVRGSLPKPPGARARRRAT